MVVAKDSHSEQINEKSTKNGFIHLTVFIEYKVNSVQEAHAKCFAVHTLTFEILQITWKK